MGKKRQRAAVEEEAGEPPASTPEEYALEGPQPKFGQALASNDKAVRDKAVKALERYLQTARDISEAELRKIWKALFYCFWHSDKPKVQADLAERLAKLVHHMPDGKAWLFASVFWSTMTREWTLIDRLRLNKFYMLMRKSLAHQLQRVARSSWAEGDVEALAGVLGGVGGPAAPKAPTGVRYFICDTFLPSVSDALGPPDDDDDDDAAASSEISPECMRLLLEPLIKLIGSSEDDGMLKRAVDGVVQPLLVVADEGAGASKRGGGGDDDGDGEEGEEEEEEEEVPPRYPKPLTAFSERLFSLASERTTKDRNRKLIYALQTRVERLAAAQTAAAAAAAKTAQATAGGRKRAGSASAAAAAEAGGKRRKAEAESAADPAKVSALKSLLAKPRRGKDDEVKGAKGAKAAAKAAAAAEAAAEAEAAEAALSAKAAAKKKKGKAAKEAEEAPAASVIGGRAGKVAVAGGGKEAEAKDTKRQKSAPEPAPAPAPAPAKPPPFIRSPKFGGAKSGYVFKKGASGVGYYVDVKPVVTVTNARGGWRQQQGSGGKPGKPGKR